MNHLFEGLSVLLSSAPRAPMDQEFFTLVFETIKNFGGIPWTLKVATGITLLISSMKVTFLRDYWDKLGWLKGFAAGFLGIVGGVLALASTKSLTLHGVCAYLFAGAGAIVMHEMLDSLKHMPGIGPKYIAIIDMIEGFMVKEEKTAT